MSGGSLRSVRWQSEEYLEAAEDCQVAAEECHIAADERELAGEDCMIAVWRVSGAC